MSDESLSSCLVKQVSKICSNKLQYAIEPDDISKLQAPSQAPSTVAKRMAVVKFVRRSMRYLCYSSKIGYFKSFDIN